MDRIRVLAVASGGGHWKQLVRLKAVLDAYNCHYVTTIDGLPQASHISSFSIVSDASRNERLLVLKLAYSISKIILKEKPHIVVSTGAAPGLLAVLIGRVFAKKTIWIDSIANGDELSMSGKLAKKISSKCLSQWKHVAETSGVDYWGRVL